MRTMRKRTITQNPFTGRWRIVPMSAWDQGVMDDEEVGYFEFEQNDSGHFHFGYVHGQMV